MRQAYAVVVLWLVAASCLAAESVAERRYPLPERGNFNLKVPVTWKGFIRQPPNSLPPTIKFEADQGKPFEVMITPIWRVRDAPVPTRESIRKIVDNSVERVKSQAVEKELKVVPFDGQAGPGWYFSATDKAPKPGEFKYMTQGMLIVRELAVSFTILTNDGEEQVVRDALGAMKSATHTP